MDLFLWLQSQDTAIWARHIPGYLNVIADRSSLGRTSLSRQNGAPTRSSESNIQTVGDSCSGHVCHNPQQTSFPVYVSSSRATRTGDRCSVTRLAGMDDVQVSTISPAQQSHSEAQDDPGGQVIPSASMEALM